MSEVLRAPFPYFGGKRRVADVVWRAFGYVPNFVEPFAGSLAVLLGRPGGAGKIETVNDLDRFICNFWRAIQADPEAVAHHADWPVNEADLHARHLWLVNRAEFRERMHTDPEFYDAKIAGWWVWGICQWIGGGWCRESQKSNHKRPKLDGIGKGVHAMNEEWSDVERKRPDLHSIGKGVHAQGITVPDKLPNLAVKADGACAGRGIHSEAAVAAYSPGRRPALAGEGQGVLLTPRRKRPQLADGAGGVHLPSLGNDRGINGVAAPPALEWFLALRERLRNVRVACGDFERVLGDSVLGKGKSVGGRRPCAVFLDPPYLHEMRSDELYAEDARGVAERARDWAIAHGDDSDLRIAFCGYAGEHAFPSTWTEYAWKGARGYASNENSNRELERVWFSPHCQSIESAQRELFAMG